MWEGTTAKKEKTVNTKCYPPLLVPKFLVTPRVRYCGTHARYGWIETQTHAHSWLVINDKVIMMMLVVMMIIILQPWYDTETCENQLIHRYGGGSTTLGTECKRFRNILIESLGRGPEVRFDISTSGQFIPILI